LLPISEPLTKRAGSGDPAMLGGAATAACISVFLLCRSRLSNASLDAQAGIQGIG
jgi:hypothetical protein